MTYAKKTGLVILTMVVLLLSTVVVHAAPRWSYITTIAADLDINDQGIATVYVLCDSDPRDTDKITAKCELQKYNGSWKTIKTWTETANDAVIDYTKTYAVAINYSYRLKITASAYMGSTLKERVSGNYSETFYH